MRQQWCIGVKFEWIHTMYFADVQQAVTTCWRVIFWNFSHIINFVIHFFIPETLECYSCRLHCSWVKSCAVHHIYNLFETSFCSENPQSCPNTKSKGLDSFCPTAQDKVGGGWLTSDHWPGDQSSTHWNPLACSIICCTTMPATGEWSECVWHPASRLGLDPADTQGGFWPADHLLHCQNPQPSPPDPVRACCSWVQQQHA